MPKLTPTEVEWHCRRVEGLYTDRANFDNMKTFYSTTMPFNFSWMALS